MAESTKTPWAFREAWADDEECEIYPAWFTPEVGSAAEICVVKEWGDVPAEANAHLIVTAVNERSALLECEKALRELAAVLDNVNPWDDEHVAQYNVAWNATSAALSHLDSIRAEVSHGK